LSSASRPGRVKDVAPPATAPVQPAAAHSLEYWMKSWLSQWLDLELSLVAADKPFAALGLDSVGAVALAGALGEHLGRHLDVNLAWDFPNIRLLAAHLAPSALSVVSEGGAHAPHGNAAPGEPIAVIGMSCRLPGKVASTDEFWRLLASGDSGIGEIPAERWAVPHYFDRDPDAIGKMYSTEGGFIAGIDQFDADFFGLPPRVVELMDPQQRLLMELGWEGLENAGLDPAALAGTATSVFIGLCSDDYLRLVDVEKAGHHASLGNSRGIAAGRCWGTS